MSDKITDLEGRLDAALKRADKHARSCMICETSSSFRWTDTHGIGQCGKCGAPYRLYHYEEGKRISKPPEIMIDPEWMDRCKAFWKETNRPMPGGFSFDPDYEVSSKEDREVWTKWNDSREEAPKP